MASSWQLALGKATSLRSAEPVVAAGGATVDDEELPVAAATDAKPLTGFVGVAVGELLAGVLARVIAAWRFSSPKGWARCWLSATLA